MSRLSLFTVLAFVSFSATAIGVAWVRKWAERNRILDHPNERSSHSHPTPRGGGLALVVVTLAVISIAAREVSGVEPFDLLIVIASAVLVAGVSWLDDLKTVRSSVRFTTHLAAASAVIWALGPIGEIPLPGVGPIALGPAAIPLTLIWIVGLTNAFNFMDGIDAIAGLQAVIAGVGWAILGVQGDASTSTLLGVSLSFAALGFLIHNWPPAKIFMGDVGSAYLGFMFAVAPLLSTLPRPHAAVAGFLFVWPFVFDSTFTLGRRLLRRENIFEAHRSHLYQRLVIAGWPHSRVTIFYGSLALLGVLVVVADSPIDPVVLPLILGAFLWLLLVAVESKPRSASLD